MLYKVVDLRYKTKHMKQIITAVAFLAISTVAIAQSNASTTPSENAKKSVAKIEKIVTLTKDQKAKLEEMELNIERRFEIIKSSTEDASKKEMYKAEVMNARQQQIQNILTADQYKKWSAASAK
jgi:hypothetical protein